MRYLLFFLFSTLLILQEACIDCEPRKSLGSSLRVFFSGDRTRFDSIKGLRMTENLFLDTILTDSAHLFPMNRLANRSTFLFMQTIKSDSVITDTLTLEYTLMTESIPPDCGYVEHLENISVRSYSFDSAYVTNPIVLFRDTINVRVQLKAKD